MHRIDKSKFNAVQLAQYEELMAIGKADVDPKAAKEEMEDDVPPVPKKKEKEGDGMEKSATSPELAAALERLATLEKSVEMKEFTDIAKKYAPLGEKEDELAQTLYNMKKSNEANYNAYIAILDKSLGLVEKSGLFAEIGKSAGNYTSGGTADKIEAKAAELRKADPTMNYHASIAKAWESNPELMAEYDDEYNGR